MILMKRIVIACLVAFVALSAFTCNKKSTDTGVYKGKLVRKGICMNYTISVIGGNIDTSKVVAQWTDPQTNTSFQHAFRLESVCNFPSDINEGDEFSFVIDNNASIECGVCLAYYPTPHKGLRIKVVNNSN